MPRPKISSLKILESERLILRPMIVDDAEMVVAWRNSDMVSSVSHKESKSTITVGDHLKWFQSTRDMRQDYIMVVKETDYPIGNLSFSSLKLPDRGSVVELGKYIGEASALGKKYASEATVRWLEYGFVDCDYGAVVARTLKTNSINIRINEKSGFKIQPWPIDLTNWSDEWIFMEILKQDWLQNKMTETSNEN